MGILKYSNSITEDDDDVESDGVDRYLATKCDIGIQPLWDASTYAEDLPVDDEFLIDVHCRYIDLNTERLIREVILSREKNSDDNTGSENIYDPNNVHADDPDDYNSEDKYFQNCQTSTAIVKTFRRPLEGFPESYEEAWHVVCKWLEEEFDTVQDSHVLAVMAEELARWALYIVNEIPRGRKKMRIDIYREIREIVIELPRRNSSTDICSSGIENNTSLFITELAAWETEDNQKEFHYPEGKKDVLDEYLVINVYTEYKPIDANRSICKTFKCMHPTNAIWGLEDREVDHVVAMMLKQVELPGELPRICLIREACVKVSRFFPSSINKGLELNMAIRITEVSQPPSAIREAGANDIDIPRLQIQSDLFLKPLCSSQFQPLDD